MKTIKLLVLAMLLWGGIALAQDRKGEIVENVSVPVEFIEGGIDGFRRQVAENFDTGAVDELVHLTREQIEERMKKIKKNKPMEGILLDTEVVFVVEIDGTLSNVEAEGPNKTFNAEAERTIKSIKGKWKPAEVNGKPVRSKFSFPMRMRFE